MRAQKAHSLIGQVYDRRNLRRAWERVRKNKGAGGVDGVTIARFEENLDRYLDVLHRQLKEGRYRPRPVKRVEIDKPGTNKKRPLGIPTIMDRVCQQALVQVLEPIFEPTFREASFGYRPGRSAHLAMRRIWRQLGQAEWIVDADISDFFGSLSHELLIDLVADRVADGKVLSLVRSMLTAGALRDGVFESAVAGTPQGGVASPLLSNIYLSVFDEKMAKAGFALTRYADDWLITCRSQTEARRALASAREVLEGKLGLRLHPEKTRIVHITRGFEFLGYKIGRGKGLRHKAGGPSLYAVPTDRSVKRFKDKVRTATCRRNPKDLEGVLDELNPIIRGWGNYYRRAKVRRLYHRLNRWIAMRVWSHQTKRWRNAGWRHLPVARLYGELGLVNLLQLIPSMQSYY
ncbi:MAG: group II intron reverse transcriptase/maturase, partial [Actinobacteria bacterium]|nr:group II intron reverse transcriptase/maturase [Actinomycetota bacterium]